MTEYAVTRTEDAASHSFVVRSPRRRAPVFSSLRVSALILSLVLSYYGLDVTDRASHLVVSLVLLVACTSHLVFEDSLTILGPSLGKQLSSTRSISLFSFLPPCPYSGSTRFIPSKSIENVVIDEAIQGVGIRYYLAIVLRKEEGRNRRNVEVVFPNTLPRLKDLESILAQTRALLYPRPDGDKL